MNRTRCALLLPILWLAAAVADAEAAVALEAKPALRLEASVGEKVLRVSLGDSAVARYPIAVGEPKHPTPTGSYRIRRVIWNPGWVPPRAPWARDKKPTPPGHPDNPMGPVKIYFADPDYFIHGTNDPRSIGRAASKGCIRMRNEDAIELAKLLMEHGGQPREPGWFRQIRNRVTVTREVYLSNPIPLRVKG